MMNMFGEHGLELKMHQMLDQYLDYYLRSCLTFAEVFCILPKPEWTSKLSVPAIF